ncbi:MAG TPA: hypothetical protein VF526_13030 [Solirubrobacteraceae bacterium]
MLRALSSLTAVALAVALVACGNEKTAAPDTGVVPAPKGFRDAKYTKEGVSLRVPKSWRTIDGEAPQIATIAAGDGQIGVWRFPRKEPLPETAIQLNAAREALIAQVQKRDKGFTVTSSRIVLKPKLKAVEIIGIGTNQGLQRSQRSLHAYGYGAEVVVDGFAPITLFNKVDKQTFSKVARSLKLRKPRP